MPKRVVLTGFMAAGKSAVGRTVARRLGWRFADSDRELAARAGKPIAAIFAEMGEAHFRRLEREIIAECAALAQPAVIATGGGALVDETNYRALSTDAVIVCLSARPEIIAERIRRSGAPRPKLLEGDKPLRERIEELMVARKEAYARAEITIDTSELTVEEAADQVLEALAARGVHRCEPSA
ncbi:MAG: shikimate kinase [Candidatus Binataceae bacterium]